MLAYEIKGRGLPVVLLHAFPLTRKMWSGTVQNLNDQFQVILPDLPGFGESSQLIQPTIPNMAREVAALLDHLKITEPVWIGGLSMGGYVTFEFLRQYPKRVRGLGFFATKAAPDSPEARENRMKSIEALEKFGMEPFVKKIVKSQLGKTTQETRPDLIQAAVDLMKNNSPEGSIDALKAMADRSDSADLLKTIRVPTLVIAGEEDAIIAPSDMEAMHQQISGSEFYSVAKSGHLINLEQPESFQKILKKFIR